MAGNGNVRQTQGVTTAGGAPISDTANPVRTGIGGWTYPPWRGGVFYPKGLRQKDELAHAAGTLGAIEINGTFHSLQKPESFRKWAETAPDGFRFAVKGSSYTTYRKDLTTAGESLAKFFATEPTALGDRLGPFCWQLMAGKKFVADEIAGFFALLPREWAGAPLRHALEVGHESFACDEFIAIARAHGVAIVYLEAEDRPAIDADTADFRYARFKQMQADVDTGYPPAELDRIASLLRGWSETREVFAFCINGAKERAPAAAMALADRLA